MKILVAIANYGQGNRIYLDRLVAEYRSMPWQVDIVVLSNVAKTIAPDVEVVVGLPAKNPWSLPFAHRSLFAARRDAYDLFIYSEDDTLVTAANIEAFLGASRELGADRVPGFLRTETAPDGGRYVSSVHGFFRWVTDDIVRSGHDVFVPFTNDHAACYLITREQLAQAIASGGFLVAPHEGRYDMLCSAATDVYTRCGLKRYVCITRLSDFLLPHLPNKYLGRMGVPLEEVESQVAALLGLAESSAWRGVLFEVESGLARGEWSKNLYEDPDEALLNLIPTGARSILSVGCGWGATEGRLAAAGMDVVAMPVDPVFVDALRRRGVKAIDGPLRIGLTKLSGQLFDCVLAADVLHLVDNPISWLSALRRVSAPTGSIVLSIPNTGDPVTRAKLRWGGARSVTRRSPLRAVSPRRLRAWLAAAGYAPAVLQTQISTPKRAIVSRASLGTASGLLAYRFLVHAAAASPAAALEAQPPAFAVVR
jgi:2-polyprenyl-3-methyl-5-hydroxy-6-metoxy-1,4-benzoquinol methylase